MKFLVIGDGSVEVSTLSIDKMQDIICKNLRKNEKNIFFFFTGAGFSGVCRSIIMTIKARGYDVNNILVGTDIKIGNDNIFNDLMYYDNILFCNDIIYNCTSRLDMYRSMLDKCDCLVVMSRYDKSDQVSRAIDYAVIQNKKVINLLDQREK